MRHMRKFVLWLDDIGDLAELIAWEQTTEFQEFIQQLERDLPAWWSTGEELPPEFVPLEQLIENKRLKLIEQEENWRS